MHWLDLVFTLHCSEALPPGNLSPNPVSQPLLLREPDKLERIERYQLLTNTLLQQNS